MLITGHRGARGEAIENTLSGFNYLKSIGVRAVELDVQMTADHQLVVFHDAVLQPMSTGMGCISDKSLADIKKLNLLQNGYFKCDETIPTLQEVFEIIHNFEHIQLEVKIYPFTKDLEHIATQLAAIYRQYPQHVIISSFSEDFLQHMQQHYPDVATGLLLEEYHSGHPDYNYNYDDDDDTEVFWPTDKALSLAQELHCQWLLPHYTILNKYLDFVIQAHANGLKVSTWTVNDYDEIAKFKNIGVDSLITDYPKRAIQTLMPTGQL